MPALVVEDVVVVFDVLAGLIDFDMKPSTAVADHDL